MQHSNVYTKTGDSGMTSLVGGFRVPKTHPRLEAYGTIDELNSFLGLLMVEVEDETTFSLLQYIQSKLFTIGSYLATDPTKTEYKIESRIGNEDVAKLEHSIDLIDEKLPKMESFVLPGGCRSAALAHVCRTVCRRAERQMYRLSETADIESLVFVFVNRLSDLLFVIARRECLLKNGKEIFWNKTCK